MNILLPANLRGSAWIGGSNYFLGLFEALRDHSRPAGANLWLLTNEPAAFDTRGELGVHVLAAPWLGERRTPAAFLNAAVAAVAGYNRLLSRAAREHHVDLVTHANPARLAPCPILYWMPDFQHRHLPHLFPPAERARRDRNVARAARAGHLLVSSQSAADDFRRFFPGSRAQVHVLRFAPREDACREPVPGAARRHGLEPGYWLLPNQFWRHKNHAVVVEALRLMPADVRVVCTGALEDVRGSAHIEELMASVTGAGLRDRFVCLGMVSREDLLSLMHEARGVLQPSLFEGWSTVVEEARLMGKQLALSDLPVHREQDPADAVYFDPRDAAALADAWRSVATADPAREAHRRRMALAAAPMVRAAFAERYWQICASIVEGSRHG